MRNHHDSLGTTDVSLKKMSNNLVAITGRFIVAYSHRCVHVEIRVHHGVSRCARDCGGWGYGIFREHKNRTLASRHQYTRSIYLVARAARVRDSFARVRARARARVRYPRLPKLQPALLQTEAESPLLLLFLVLSLLSSHPSPFQMEWGKTAEFAYIRRHTLSALISPATAGN